MGGLQSCHRCAAQFDVSSFTLGQQFTCGSCGAVLTVRVPEGPRISRRGATSRPRRGSYRGRERKGVSPALIFGGGALAIVAISLILVLGGRGGEDEPPVADRSSNVKRASPSSGPSRRRDTLSSLKAQLRATSPRSPSDYRAWAERFLAVGGDDAEREARRLYTTLLEQHDPDDLVARKYLGYTDFQADILERVLSPDEDPIPEELNNRQGYDFLDAVVEFSKPARRWMKDEDEIELARKAVAQMRKHAKRLREDRVYRAGDSIRGVIANDPLLKDLNYATIWRAPYLVCYSSSESLSDYELLKLPREERKARQAEFARKRMAWDRILEEKAAIFKGAYDEWMRRYAEPLGLKPLTDEYGGRPDYREGVRSFKDGVPLCIWIFTDHSAFQEYHAKYKGGELQKGVAGYFMPTTGWIFLFDDDGTTKKRMFEINKQVHEGVHQLEYWFTRQRNKWRPPVVGQNAISEGIAEYLGAVQMDIDRRLRFVHLNPTRLEGMQQYAAQIKPLGRDYPIFPIERLLSFETYQQASDWVATEWRLPRAGMTLLYQQSWALTYFLQSYEDGRYREKWMRFFDAVLDRQTGNGMAASVFSRIFGLQDEEDWEVFDSEWQTFVRDDLMRRDVTSTIYEPPGRDEWPDD